MQITEFKGKKWAIGLDWETLPGDASIKQEAKEVAEKTNCNFGILIDYDAQYAIGLSQKLPKEPSAALYLALANQEVRNNQSPDEEHKDWVVIEEVGDEKYWMAIIRNGLPYPQSDTVDDLTTIRTKCMDLIQGVDTYNFYSPCGEIITLFDGIKYVESKGLNELTVDIKTKKKFEKLRGIPNSVIYAGIGLIATVVILMGVSSLWEGHTLREKAENFKRQQEEQERQAQQLYQNELKAYNAGIQKGKADLVNSVVLGLQGTPRSILSAWYDKVGSQETGTHGWDLKKIECYFNPQAVAPAYPLGCDFQYQRNGLSTNRMLLQDYPTAIISGNDAVVKEQIDIANAHLQPVSTDILNTLPNARSLGLDMVSQLQLMKIVDIDYETKDSTDITFTSGPKPLSPEDKKQGKTAGAAETIDIGVAKGQLIIKNNNFELLKELADNIDFKAVGVKKATFVVKQLGEMDWQVDMDYYIKTTNGGLVGASSSGLSNTSVPVTPSIDNSGAVVVTGQPPQTNK